VADLSFTDVGEIVGLIDRLDCDAFSLEYGELKISLRRGAAPLQEPSAPPPRSTPVRQVDVGERVAGAVDLPSAPVPAAIPDETPSDWVAVRAPMIGTFYRRRSPDEPPLVEVGDAVQPGQVVGLIEVMKLFSDLKAEQAGTVARIDAADAALVEFGQPLVWVKPGEPAPSGGDVG
jgi:acetyl-CoA carboxylase biotin carboxyl carrier protein